MQKIKEWLYKIFAWKREKNAVFIEELPQAPVIEIPKPFPKKKNKPRKKIIRRCLQTDKFMFTREEAEKNRDKRKNSTQDKYLRIYCCEFCGKWHLTHKRRHDW